MNLHYAWMRFLCWVGGHTWVYKWTHQGVAYQRDCASCLKRELHYKNGEW